MYFRLTNIFPDLSTHSFCATFAKCYRFCATLCVMDWDEMGWFEVLRTCYFGIQISVQNTPQESEKIQQSNNSFIFGEESYEILEFKIRMGKNSDFNLRKSNFRQVVIYISFVSVLGVHSSTLKFFSPSPVFASFRYITARVPNCLTFFCHVFFVSFSNSLFFGAE